ncbi:hypothetical protein EBQ34_03885 [Vandammella animalimorsus]|uniref:Uncharacterized protein n=1 Tax=Vandammella animalimorsus TaxID=2029117 RepID=A0A3M6RR66_9BURK|nr:DUF6616 family protein [Vandammella animalimorsus]RMX17484.1 hypothetical protein EBQ34_03885 [Vandammella animalimorsus]
MTQQYLVELYTPNAAWLALPAKLRQAFISQINQGMQGLAGAGIELLSLAPTAKNTPHASAHRFLGIWRFDNAQARDALLAGIEASGWYLYFDHLNAASATGALQEHLQDLLHWQGAPQQHDAAQ